MKYCTHWLLLALVVLASGCVYDAAQSEYYCDKNGVEEDGRRCEDGVWVAIGDDGGDAGMDASGDGGQCVPETDDGLCTRLGFDCDEVTAPDNCGDTRTVDCGTCPDGQTCGGSGTPNVCDCEAETDGEFCRRQGLSCGLVTGVDNCGAMRVEVDCGTCSDPATCGGGGTDNVCGCDAQTDEEFCDQEGAECGIVTALDLCNQMRTVPCGDCVGLDGCGEAGAENVCGCGPDADVCADLGLECGTVNVMGQCSDRDSIDCGGCDTNAACATNLCECSAGYTGDGLTCTDVDECADGTDNCDTNATCGNTDGGFDCTCNSGYTGDGVTCNDIDECAANTDNCDANATCANTPGSYTCSCNTGYTGNGMICSDVDECATNTDNCDANAACTNTPGSYTCSCESGYTGDGMTCSDIDECADGTDLCATDATCNNTDGGYGCTCNSGYTGDGFSCSDVDECSANTDNCDTNATCTNNNGGFDCTCNSGYTGDGFTCNDVDECANMTDACDVNATCTNIDGSYDCNCDSGYTGDGFTCTPTPGVVSQVVPVTVTVGSGNTAATGTLSSSVIVADSAIFVTKRMSSTGDSFRDTAVDVSLSSSNQLLVERTDTAGSVTVVAYVVEFDSTKVRVQSGTFSIGGNDLSVNAGLSNGVDQTRSFILFQSNSTNIDDATEETFVTASFAADDTLTFERDKTDGTQAGHYWVVESLNGDFTVEHVAMSMLGSEASQTATITPVQLDKAFLLWSITTASEGEDAAISHVECTFSSASEVACGRESGSPPREIPVVNAQVVSLTGGESVQRGTMSLATSEDDESTTLTTPVDAASAVPIYGRLGMPGAVPAPQSMDVDYTGTFVTHELTSSGASLRFQRGSATVAASLAWQVVEW